MSYRINRAIGYGMPFSQFEELCILPRGNADVSDVLYETFKNLYDADLTVDDKIYRALFYGDGLKPSTILDPKLLNLEFRGTEIGHAIELFELVSTPDETTDIIFFPNLNFRRRWYRTDDDIDFAFERFRDSPDGADTEPQDYTKYVKFGHYPFTNDIMDYNGNPLKWDHYMSTLHSRDDWLPGIPSEIRWYLTQFGVMLNEGVNQLRPVFAQWWN